MTETPSSARAHSRPLSPHLQIYRPQLTSILSILHRMTGAALVFGLLILSGWIVSAAMGPEAYSRFSSLLNTIIGKLLLVGFSWALFYHLCNGIRHLFWDAGYGLELQEAYRSGWSVVIFSFLLTAACWSAVCYVGRHPMDFGVPHTNIIEDRADQPELVPQVSVAPEGAIQ